MQMRTAEKDLTMKLSADDSRGFGASSATAKWEKALLYSVRGKWKSLILLDYFSDTPRIQVETASCPCGSSNMNKPPVARKLSQTLICM